MTVFSVTGPMTTTEGGNITLTVTRQGDLSQAAYLRASTVAWGNYSPAMQMIDAGDQEEFIGRYIYFMPGSALETLSYQTYSDGVPENWEYSFVQFDPIDYFGDNRFSYRSGDTVLTNMNSNIWGTKVYDPGLEPTPYVAPEPTYLPPAPPAPPTPEPTVIQTTPEPAVTQTTPEPTVTQITPEPTVTQTTPLATQTVSTPVVRPQPLPQPSVVPSVVNNVFTNVDNSVTNHYTDNSTTNNYVNSFNTDASTNITGSFNTDNSVNVDNSVNTDNSVSLYSYTDLLNANDYSIAKTINGSRSLQGTSANDLIIGGKGADALIGAAGNDRLIGRAGKDRLYGGLGSNVFNAGTTSSKRDADRLYIQREANAMTADIIESIGKSDRIYIQGTTGDLSVRGIDGGLGIFDNDVLQAIYTGNNFNASNLSNQLVAA